jgi:S-adenosylmethionine:tRNA ribosyltransferase-isomerase
MKTDDFDYDLPEKFIAQVPATPRDSCKLMVVQRGGALEHRRFYDIKEYLRPGDLLVVNETRVLPARLLGKKKGTGGHVETLLLDKVAGAPCTNEEQTWNCLVKPGKRLKVGSQVVYEADGVCLLEGEILSIDPGNGSRAVRFSVEPGKDVDAAFHAIGHTPLPPYIKDYTGDEELYQTVYARDERSAAAPTAGLHFTRELLESLQAAGVGLATVDLEVGLDTFRIVGEDDPLDHQMHTELYTVPPETVKAIQTTKQNGGRVIAVGTTSVRSLESAAAQGELGACTREATSLYILPGYEFRVCDAIITNFHVPRSTLMMLVSAFAGRDAIMNAYEEAKEHDYRFFSFGDAMLLL